MSYKNRNNYNRRLCVQRAPLSYLRNNIDGCRKFLPPLSQYLALTESALQVSQVFHSRRRSPPFDDESSIFFLFVVLATIYHHPTPESLVVGVCVCVVVRAPYSQAYAVPSILGTAGDTHAIGLEGVGEGNFENLIEGSF